MDETRRLAEWLAGLRYEDLPREVVDFTKRFILDDVGCLLGGAVQLGNKALLKDVLTAGEKEECTIPVYGYKTSAPSAALLNGAFICGWDYDSSALGGSHLGSQTAAVLAMAERELADGREIITAECAGIETQCRIGINHGYGTDFPHPWHSNTVLGPFAAAAAAGKILGFDAKQMENALAIATHNLGGNYQHYYGWGSSMKRIRCGIGAWSGVRAALLAREGLEGPLEALEGPGGFLEAINGRADDGSPFYNQELITDGLGTKWYTLTYRSKGGACYCVSALGSALETILMLKDRYLFRPEDVESVTLEFANMHTLRECNWITGTELGATPEQRLGSSGWSARWMAAETLLIGKPTIRNQLRNIRPYGRYREIEELSKKVSCRINREYYDELDRKGIYYPDQAGRVLIKLKDGKVLDGEPLPYKGLNDARPENLHTFDSLAQKLAEQATAAGLSKAKQTRIVEFIQNLDNKPHLLNLIPQLIRG
ncbi:MAG: MmgE/PrpD family protein [Nitrososphaerota archaeon]